MVVGEARLPHTVGVGMGGVREGVGLTGETPAGRPGLVTEKPVSSHCPLTAHPFPTMKGGGGGGNQ